jgi:hypothetical protein
MKIIFIVLLVIFVSPTFAQQYHPNLSPYEYSSGKKSANISMPGYSVSFDVESNDFANEYNESDIRKSPFVVNKQKEFDAFEYAYREVEKRNNLPAANFRILYDAWLTYYLKQI